ncbi:hypothetical protein BJY01DRAFT_224812 [Aspergillus pseudoustus]|uniref:Uncharacterized protein n=1 Tax=Aspergillus pseudoustus TaxID=1810923 RepID=A0ABR4J1Q7_9EURO
MQSKQHSQDSSQRKQQQSTSAILFLWWWLLLLILHLMAHKRLWSVTLRRLVRVVTLRRAIILRRVSVALLRRVLLISAGNRVSHAHDCASEGDRAVVFVVVVLVALWVSMMSERSVGTSPQRGRTNSRSAERKKKER